MALDVYQQELNRLMQPPSSSTTPTTAVAAASTTTTPSVAQPTSNGFPQDLSLPKSAVGSVRSDEEGSERDVKARAPSSAKSHLSGVENGDSKAETPSVSLKTENSMMYMPHSLHNILRPSSSPSPDEPNTTTAVSGSGGPGGPGVPGGAGGVASPLQRIASITNSLMSQPANPTLPQVTQRPMKAILPPITQQQFDTYQNLNTEDIVKKV